MELKTTLRVVGIKKKTSAKFFKDLKVGDIFTLSYNLNGLYANSAPWIKISVKNEVVHGNNASQLKSNLSNFELQEGNFLCG